VALLFLLEALAVAFQPGDELPLLQGAFESNWIAPLGPHVDAFEREFAAVVGVPHAAALSSGTGALHLALQILGVGSGDTVLWRAGAGIAGSSHAGLGAALGTNSAVDLC
jgi:dTDP-4-amino-4,6-dideoxygalactose transaminase